MPKPSRVLRIASQGTAKGISRREQASYLRAHGWQERDWALPWRWTHPRYRVRTWRTLRDAYDLERTCS